MNTLLKIDGMTCKNCARHVREALEKVSGVDSVNVDLDAASAQISGGAYDTQALIAAVKKAGYGAKESAG